MQIRLFVIIQANLSLAFASINDCLSSTNQQAFFFVGFFFQEHIWVLGVYIVISCTFLPGGARRLPNMQVRLDLNVHHQHASYKQLHVAPFVNCLISRHSINDLPFWMGLLPADLWNGKFKGQHQKKNISFNVLIWYNRRNTLRPI